MAGRLRQVQPKLDFIEVAIITSSPLILHGLAPFLTSGLMSGGETKLVIINGQKVTYAKGDNAYNMVVADKALVRVKGSSGVDDDTLRNYLRALKLSDLEKVAK